MASILSLTFLSGMLENIWAKATEILSTLRDTVSVRIEILPPKMLDSVVLLLPAIFLWPEGFSLMILADIGQ